MADDVNVRLSRYHDDFSDASMAAFRSVVPDERISILATGDHGPQPRGSCINTYTGAFLSQCDHDILYDRLHHVAICRSRMGWSLPLVECFPGFMSGKTPKEPQGTSGDWLVDLAKLKDDRLLPGKKHPENAFFRVQAHIILMYTFYMQHPADL